MNCASKSMIYDCLSIILSFFAAAFIDKSFVKGLLICVKKYPYLKCSSTLHFSITLNLYLILRKISISFNYLKGVTKPLMIISVYLLLLKILFKNLIKNLKISQNSRYLLFPNDPKTSNKAGTCGEYITIKMKKVTKS